MNNINIENKKTIYNYNPLSERKFFSVKEKYEDLEKKIETLGSIKEILNDEKKLNKILAYKGDSRILCVLFNKVNQEISKSSITKKDLHFFKSGKLIDAIINLEETVKTYGNRYLFLNERMDKINYISIINDLPTLNISYTHPAIIDGLCGTANYDKRPYELNSIKTFGTFQNLPKEVQLAIISSVLKKENYEIGQELIQIATEKIKKYPQINIDYEKYNEQFKKIKRFL